MDDSTYARSVTVADLVVHEARFHEQQEYLCRIHARQTEVQ